MDPQVGRWWCTRFIAVRRGRSCARRTYFQRTCVRYTCTWDAAGKPTIDDSGWLWRDTASTGDGRLQHWRDTAGISTGDDRLQCKRVQQYPMRAAACTVCNDAAGSFGGKRIQRRDPAYHGHSTHAATCAAVRHLPSRREQPPLRHGGPSDAPERATIPQSGPAAAITAATTEAAIRGRASAAKEGRERSICAQDATGLPRRRCASAGATAEECTSRRGARSDHFQVRRRWRRRPLDGDAGSAGLVGARLERLGDG